MPYRENNVGLDPNSLNKYIDVPVTVKKVVPTQVAIIEADFDGNRHDRRFARIFDSHRQPLPFGTAIEDASHAEIGIVGAAGVLLADFTHRPRPFTARLNGKVLCHIGQPETPATSLPSDSSTLWKLSCL